MENTIMPLTLCSGLVEAIIKWWCFWQSRCEAIFASCGWCTNYLVPEGFLSCRRIHVGLRPLDSSELVLSIFLNDGIAANWNRWP